MYTNKTIANSPYEEALSEFRAAVPNLQAIADRAFAPPRRTSSKARVATSRIGIRGRSNRRIFRTCAMVVGRTRPLKGCTTLRRIASVPCRSSQKADSGSRGISIFTFVFETNKQIIETIYH